MNKLLVILLLSLLTSIVRGQILITNIRVSGVITGTNDNINISVNTNQESAGFALFFEKQKMLAEQLTNPPPTAQQAIRDAVNEMLIKVLAEQARAHKRKTNSVASFFNYGAASFELMTAQQQADFIALISSPNIKTNLPAQ